MTGITGAGRAGHLDLDRVGNNQGTKALKDVVAKARDKNNRISLLDLSNDCLDYMTGYLKPFERAVFAGTCTTTHKLHTAYPSEIQKDRDAINEIKAALPNPDTLLETEVQTLITKYSPFAIGEFKTRLDTFITSQLLLLEVKSNALFNLLKLPVTKETQEQVNDLINANPLLVYATDVDGYTPLHWAASEGHTEIAQALLDNGADIEARGSSGYTPLHWAAQNGQTEIAQALITARADVNARDRSGVTPLHWAAQKGHTEIAALLHNAGATK